MNKATNGLQYFLGMAERAFTDSRVVYTRQFLESIWQADKWTKKLPVHTQTLEYIAQQGVKEQTMIEQKDWNIRWGRVFAESIPRFSYTALPQAKQDQTDKQPRLTIRINPMPIHRDSFYEPLISWSDRLDGWLEKDRNAHHALNRDSWLVQNLYEERKRLVETWEQWFASQHQTDGLPEEKIKSARHIYTVMDHTNEALLRLDVRIPETSTAEKINLQMTFKEARELERAIPRVITHLQSQREAKLNGVEAARRSLLTQRDSDQRTGIVQFVASDNYSSLKLPMPSSEGGEEGLQRPKAGRDLPRWRAKRLFQQWRAGEYLQRLRPLERDKQTTVPERLEIRKYYADKKTRAPKRLEIRKHYVV